METNYENAGEQHRAHRSQKTAAQKARESAAQTLRDLVDQELANGRSIENITSAVQQSLPMTALPQLLPKTNAAMGRELGQMMDARDLEINPPEAGKTRRAQPAQGRRGVSISERSPAGRAAVSTEARKHGDVEVKLTGQAFCDYVVPDFDCYIGEMTKEKLVAWGRRSRERNYIADTLASRLVRDEDTVQAVFEPKEVRTILSAAKVIR